MMMKKIAIAAIAVAALPASGMAATSQSTTGFTFTVSPACTVTGTPANLGTFVGGETASASYTIQQGITGSQYGQIDGTGAINPIATVQCTAGVPWKLQVLGSGPYSETSAIAPDGTTAFNTIPTSYDSNGGSARYLNDAAGLAGTGTGSNQVVSGRWIYDADQSAIPSTVIFQTGNYTGTATALLTF